MLKSIRVVLAIISILAVTLLFLDFTGTARSLWPWMAQIQFMPALLSANLIALILIFAGTLIFGRIYCSIICPLGIFQDMVNWIRGKVGSKKSRFARLHYVEEHYKLRLIVFTAFVILIILGLTTILASLIAGLIEPYSAYGRIASQLFAPVYDGINNILANWSQNNENYLFYPVAAVVSIPILLVAIATLIVIVITSWQGGRDYCNTICPVGTILGYVAKYSWLKPVINTDKCVNCNVCSHKCKAKCINSKEHKIDYTRCVACMDCIEACTHGAISYRPANPKKPTKLSEKEIKSRRGFVSASSILIGGLAVDALANTDGGLTALKQKQPSKRAKKVLPAGAQGQSHMDQHCTGCQLCIQACPSKVLKPTLLLEGFMQPQLDFTEGYCPTNCVECSNICPAGAFHPLTEIQKSSIKVGTAVVNLASCLSASEGESCGSCASHCPTGAISMAPMDDEAGYLMPIVNPEMCIGCGACEYHCPVGSVATMEESSSAIHVEGIDRHRII